MKLLYAIIDENRYVVESKGHNVCLLTSETEVSTGYGFESPEADNQWIFKHCGIRVYRKYLYLVGNDCTAVFEPVGSTALKDGYTWASEDQISGSEPDMISALRLAQNGERSKTAPWMGQHGILRYLDWAKTKLTGLGYTIQGTIQQVKNAYVSSIFRIPTNAGTMYLKITASVYVNTAAVEQQIANSVGSLPVFIALSPDGYAVITKEMPGHDCQSGNASSYKTWLENWGEQQVRTAEKNIFNLADRSPQKLLSGISAFEHQINRIFEAASHPLSVSKWELLHRRLAEIKIILEKLCQYPIPNAVCHGDIRPGNVRITDDAEILYDWGMAFYGHPFYDALHFLHVVRRQLSDQQKAEIICSYLSKWEHFCDKQMLLDAYALAEQCKEYFMLAADFQWVADILKVCSGIPPLGTIDNWLLSKRFDYLHGTLHKFLSETV